MQGLSIIIPFLNEGLEPKNTIESIYSTIDNIPYEIIAIDDFSTNSVSLDNLPNVKLIRNVERRGVDANRQMGVEMAQFKNVLVVDAHMRFKNDNWASKMIKYIEDNPQTLWCTTCIALGWGTLDLNNHKGKYYGANLKLFTEKEKNRPCRMIVEPIWAAEKSETEYKIDCILGANYFFNKDWFLHIGGLKGLKSWGTSEPFLSIKSYLAGGDCKITKDIEIAHIFRDNAPYTTSISFLVQNKIYVLKTIFPKELEEKLTKYLPKDRNYGEAMKEIERNKAQTEWDRNYYQYIFKRDIYDYFKEFNIEIPN